MDTVAEIGNVNVRKIVEQANRSEIHRHTGISLSGVSRILSGKRVARTDNLAAIAVQLGVPMDDLYIYLVSLRTRLERAGSRPKAVRRRQRLM